MTKLQRRKLVHQKQLEPGKLKLLTGAHDDVLSQALCNQLHNAFWFSPNYTERDQDEQRRAALCALEGLKPTTEAEGMLAVQNYGVPQTGDVSRSANRAQTAIT